MLTCTGDAETHPDLSFQVLSCLLLLACAGRWGSLNASCLAMQEIKKRVHKSWMGMSADNKAAYEVRAALPATCTACFQAGKHLAVQTHTAAEEPAAAAPKKKPAVKAAAKRKAATDDAAAPKAPRAKTGYMVRPAGCCCLACCIPAL